MDEIEQIKQIAIHAGWNTLLKDSPEYQVFALADSFKAEVKPEVKDIEEPKKEKKVSKPKKRSKK